MNVVDILKYGDLTVQKTIAQISFENWGIPGVCGVWSVREIMAHLGSFEMLLAEVLSNFVGEEPTPNLDEFRSLGGEKFNDVQLPRWAGLSPEETVEKYTFFHQRVMDLAKKIPSEIYRQNGTLPWYGKEYCLDDYIVYSNYAHKREHMAQVSVFSDYLKGNRFGG